ncbi:MAG: RloB domain-containing protein [Prevotella sp.]|nr:RloB domain-containing protein [Prevotella sp.]
MKEGYDYGVCLLDMDRLNSVPAEMKKYRTFKNRKENKAIMFIETNPCTEFWFLLHFLPKLQVKHYTSYEQLLPELQKYMPGYEKTKKYFVRTKLYDYLLKHGSLENAMKNGEALSELASLHPEDKIAYSQVARVLKLLEHLKSENIR